jgi:NADPH:quinone reductase-like Zn-dependent oxidoreductase
MKVKAGNCIPLNKDLNLDQAASAIVNPLTAVALVEIVKAKKEIGFVNTAAAGALGKMLIKLAKQEGLTCINIVRRKEQVQELQKQGAAIVLNSSEEDFYSQLKETYKKTNVKVILDAIGGEISNTLLTPAPEDATLICYASLTREMMQINPVPILRFGKTIEGFHLAYWTKRQSMVKLLRTVKKAQRLIANDILSTPVQKKVDLNEINGAIKLYKENMTAGKVLIAF